MTYKNVFLFLSIMSGVGYVMWSLLQVPSLAETDLDAKLLSLRTQLAFLYFLVSFGFYSVHSKSCECRRGH